jgi:hypothetical protein
METAAGGEVDVNHTRPAPAGFSLGTGGGGRVVGAQWIWTSGR